MREEIAEILDNIIPKPNNTYPDIYRIITDYLIEVQILDHIENSGELCGKIMYIKFEDNKECWTCKTNGNGIVGTSRKLDINYCPYIDFEIEAKIYCKLNNIDIDCLSEDDITDLQENDNWEQYGVVTIENVCDECFSGEDIFHMNLCECDAYYANIEELIKEVNEGSTVIVERGIVDVLKGI